MASFLDMSVDRYKGYSILLDVDGTLCTDGENEISFAYKEKVQQLALHNTVYLFSNGKRERNEKLAEELGVKVLLPLWRKPFPWIRGYISKPVVVVGDKYTTDGAFALLRGYSLYKVKSMRGTTESTLARWGYWVDTCIEHSMPYVQLMRPHQWVKNLLVFTPAFFAGVFFVPTYTTVSLFAFIAFSLVSSCVYIVNDIIDRHSDAQHPTKKYRVIASGRVSVRAAYRTLVVLSILSLLAMFFIPESIPVFLLYVLLNIWYSLYLKKEPVVDVVVIAVFYCLRVFVGGVVLGLFLSPWIILCVFFGSLFVILGKRLAEYEKDGRREVLEKYNRETLLLLYGTSLSLSLLTYTLYTVLGHSDHPKLVYSTLFVVGALLRMVHLVSTKHKSSEAPELLVFKDKVVFFSFIAWVLYVGFVFY